MSDLAEFFGFYTMTHQKAEALETLERLYRTNRDESIGMYMVHACDELDKKEQRNRMLGDFTGTSAFAKLAKVFRDTLAKGEKEGLDAKAVEQTLVGAEEKFKGGVYFHAVRFLECRGKTKEACEYFDRCTKCTGMPEYMTKVAKVRLREYGFEPKDKSPK